MKKAKCENNEYYRLQNLPYEKYLSYGSSALTDAELLSIILRNGTPKTDVRTLGETVLAETSKYGNGLLGLYHITREELEKIDGIGTVKAIQLKALSELCTRMSQLRAKDKLSFRDPYSIADYYMERLRHENVEYVFLLLFDSGLHLIGEKVLSKGTINASLLSPREVYINAFEGRAAYIILLHNHPGGDPVPSDHDIEVTKRIGEIGKLTDIPLSDHIIIGDNSYFSFRESHLMN